MMPTGKLVNQYRILRRLGSGAHGTVYLAEDTKLIRPAVLKMVRPGAASSERARLDLLREARMASAIDHPNVCAIFEVNESGNEAYIAMQFLPGRTLDQIIDRGPLDLSLAASIGIQIADGLSEAHRLGILHRDLKPANVMVSETGRVKILDFGLARRDAPGMTANGGQTPEPTGTPSSPRLGTLAYMAPEQFVTLGSSEGTDVFALGVILYQTVCGVHPFFRPGAAQAQLARAIQFERPTPPSEIRPEVSAGFEGLILKAMDKQPAKRLKSAAALRDGLRTLVHSSDLEVEGLEDSQLPANSPLPKKRQGLFATIADKLSRAERIDIPPNSIAVLPFTDLDPGEGDAFFGVALADAIAVALTRLPNILVRPSGATLGSPVALDTTQAARKLGVSHILAGNYMHSKDAFSLNWQLIDAGSRSIRTGGSISIRSIDPVAIQSQICDEVYAALRGTSLTPNPESAVSPSLPGALSEEYLQARALLSNFELRSSDQGDLDEAARRLEAVLEAEESFAPAHSGLGVIHLKRAQTGYGNRSEVEQSAACFARALELHPRLLEAKLFRIFTFMALGEKDTARHEMGLLLENSGDDFSVRLVAGIVLRMDGLLDESLAQFNKALQLNPGAAPLVYYHRARIHLHQDRPELAMGQINAGLALEPSHPLLRVSLGYLYFTLGRHEKAIATLRPVYLENRNLRMVYPTLALCHLAAGQRREALAMITPETEAAADADGETAYRLATFHAADGNTVQALRWLRKAIYLGNENLPRFTHNPAWKRIGGDSDFGRTLSDLKLGHRLHSRGWRRLLARVG